MIAKMPTACRGKRDSPCHDKKGTEKDIERVESFSDGVISIAVTLLILEIKVPKADEIVSVILFAKLLDLWPSLLAFVTSFGTILVMWVNHHRMFRLVRTTDYPFLYWNPQLGSHAHAVDQLHAEHPGWLDVLAPVNGPASTGSRSNSRSRDDDSFAKASVAPQ